jgi:two-component system, sensor histidine kinase
MAVVDVLVVDDERVVALDICNTLSRLGYNVAGVVSSGEEALELAQRMHPHIVLMDIWLQGSMDGVQAAAELRKRHGVPVIFLTSFSDEDTLQRAKTSEAFGYLIKPFEERELHSTIELALYKHRAEKSLIEAKRSAERDNLIKSMFLANMSHEIRTPMNGIIGMAELALEQTVNEELRDCLETIKHSADNLLELINDILDLSKIEARKLTLADRAFNLPEVLEKVLKTHTPLARRKGLTLNCFYGHGVPARLRGDSLRLAQVCGNLVGNAVKFTDKGEVEVEVNLVTVPVPWASLNPLEHLHAEAEAMGMVKLLFSVRDTGVGIPESKHELIFESYQQADHLENQQQGGTGLGLAICKELVRMMGGAIWLRSREGQGSTFYFTAGFRLPQPDGEVEPRDQAGAPTLDLDRKLKVLVADDNQVSRKLASRLLERRGHKAACVENGAQALSLLDTETFDLVLMNIQMPVMNGLEATRRIRGGQCQATPASVPIVALTAHALLGDRERFLAAGMDEYLAKPLSAKTFFQTVARVVQAGESGKHVAPSKTEAPLLLDEEEALARIGSDAELLRDLWLAFHGERDDKLTALCHARETTDPERCAKAAHVLAGEAAGIGAPALRKAAVALETSLRQGAPVDVVLLDVLENTLTRTIAALGERLGLE